MLYMVQSIPWQQQQVDWRIEIFPKEYLQKYQIVQTRFLRKEKLDKLLGKLEISGQTESAYFYGIMDICRASQLAYCWQHWYGIK